MKKAMKIGMNLLITLFLVSATANANVPPSPIDDLSIVKAAKGAKSLEVRFDQVKAREVIIQVKDLSGYVLFTERVNGTTRYGKKYDLRELPAGNYLLTLANSIKEVIQPVLVTDTGLEVEPAARRVVFQPSIRLNDNKLDLSLLLGAKEDVELTIFNSASEVVFTDIVEDEFNIQKRYALKKLPRGRYTVKVKTAFKTFYKEVIL